jgi:hypothetical protein
MGLAKSLRRAQFNALLAICKEVSSEPTGVEDKKPSYRVR